MTIHKIPVAIIFESDSLNEEKKWIQKAVPPSHEGQFKAWCNKHGFNGVSQACINKATAKKQDGSAQYPDAIRMANFAINVSKGKYKHPNK